MANRLKRDYPLIILSFVLAVIFWGYAMDVKNPEQEIEVKNVVVKLQDANAGPDITGLTVLKGDGQTVNVKIRGRRNELVGINASQISASASLSGLTKTGDYDLPVDISTLNENISVVSSKPVSVSVKIDKMATVSIPVRIVSDIKTESGYSAMTPVASPNVISVTGPQADVNYISYADVKLSVNGLKEDTTVPSEFTLINKNGDSIINPYITTDTNKVDVKISVSPMKIVPIKANITGEANLSDGYCLASSDMSLKSVSIAAKQEVLDGITQISLEPVDISGLSKTTVFNPKLLIPDGVTVIDNISTVQLTANIEPFVTKIIQVNNISTSNVPNGDELSYSDAPIYVKIRATESFFKSMTGNEISAIIDLKNQDYSQGNHDIQLSFESNNLPAYASILGTYYISVDIRKTVG